MPVTPPRQILANFARFGHGISEFSDDRSLNGTCTQTALEVCVAAVQNRAPDTSRMIAYTHVMQKLRDAAGNPLAAANGATTLAHIAWYARAVLGMTVATEWDYAEPLSQDWLSLLRAHAGTQPILMQVAHGAALIDAETHVRPEAAVRGLRYHAIAIVGRQEDGYIVADGDNPQVTQRFQIYDRATLAAAVPCGLMMLAMPSPHAPAPPPHPLPVPVPVKPLPPDASAPLRAALAQIQTLATNALK